MNWVALLRGINVGGKNKLAMKDLQAMFQAAGCDEVETYIQSGNVVFQRESTVGLAAAIEATILKKLRLKVPVVLRSAKDLSRVTTGNPYLKKTAPEQLHVVFLADAPSREAAAKLDPARSPGDEYQLVGREIFLRLPNGMGRTRLSNDYFDRTLATLSTARNWRTVMTLAEMAGV
jgi:uncharacterized protein (DUF1697 family)